MFEAEFEQLLGQFSELNQIAIALDARKSFSNECRILFEKVRRYLLLFLQTNFPIFILNLEKNSHRRME